MTVTRIAYSDRLNAGRYAALVEQASRLGQVPSFAMADIGANLASAKVEVRRAITRRTNDPVERPVQHCRRRAGPVVAGGSWSRTAQDGQRIPLSTTHAPTGTLRLILRGGPVEVHYQIDASQLRSSQRMCGDRRIGVARRGDHAKARRIRANNLGTAKRDRQAARHHARVRTEIFTAVHRVVDKAATVVAEDLTKSFAGRKALGRNVNRRLAAWTKGVTAEALANVSERRGSALVHVNAAYTSQACHRCGRLGRRSGDRLHCTRCGVVWQADVNVDSSPATTERRANHPNRSAMSN